MALYMQIVVLIHLPVIVLGFLDGYILDVNPGCGADESSPTNIRVRSDLDIFVEVTCKADYFMELIQSDMIYYTGTAKVSGDPSSECIFVKKEHSRTYTLRLSVGYGDPGSVFFTYQDEFIITCTYDENAQSDTQGTDIVQGLTAPDEIQKQVSNAAPTSSFALSIRDILGNPLTGSVHIGKRVKLMAEMIPTDLNEVKLVTICQDAPSKTIQCNEGKIKIIEATYGRSYQTECYTYDDAIKCHAYSSYYLTRQNCDGKTECVLDASNSVYGDPCPSFQKYLSVSYTCQDNILVCGDNSETITCDGDEVIRITSAKLGHRTSATCVPEDTTVPCSNVNVMAIIGALCDGQSSCVVTPPVPSSVPVGCSDPVKYLTVSYRCGKAFTLCNSQSGSLTCSNNKKLRIIDAEYLYLPEQTCSHTVATDNCRSLDALRVAHNSCYGKGTCDLTSDSSMFGTYCGAASRDLQVFYECVNIEVSATAVSCDAVGTTLRYSVLRAGCGDGIILRQDQGLTTNGKTITSPYFQSFRLFDSVDVAFECNFTVCYDTCDGSSCFKTSRRRKRDLSDMSYDLDQYQLEAKHLESVQQDKLRNKSAENGESERIQDLQEEKTDDNIKQTTKKVVDENTKGVPDTKEGYQNKTGSLNDADQNMADIKNENENNINVNQKSKQEHVDKSSETDAEKVNYPERTATSRTKVFKFKTQHDSPKVRGSVELVRKNYKINDTNHIRNISESNVLTEQKNRYDKMFSNLKQVITMYSENKEGQETRPHDTDEHVQKMENWKPSSSLDKNVKNSNIKPFDEEEMNDASRGRLKINTHIYNMSKQLRNKHTFYNMFYITCGIVVGVMMSVFICFVLRKRNHNTTTGSFKIRT